jgi:hypothetical protein
MAASMSTMSVSVKVLRVPLTLAVQPSMRDLTVATPPPGYVRICPCFHTYLGTELFGSSAPESC